MPVLAILGVTALAADGGMIRAHGMVDHGQDPDRLLLVERHRALELGGPDARVDLGRVEPRVAKQGAHLLEVLVNQQTRSARSPRRPRSPCEDFHEAALPRCSTMDPFRRH